MLRRTLPLLAAALLACTDPPTDAPPAPERGPSAEDLDGDGQLNGDDADVDGDGEPNAIDPDIDGDGIVNDDDDDPDGDGVLGAADEDPRGAGDQIGPHGDVDGDGTPNHADADNDGDGIPDAVTDGEQANENDDADGYCFSPEGGYYGCDDGAPPLSGGLDGRPTDDLDGDGTPDDEDPDRDGDGEVNVLDPTPDGDFELPPPAEDDPPPGPGQTCTQETFAIQTDDPRILLVVDHSGSMDQEATGYPGTKWTAAVDALSSVVTALDQDVAFGLMVYPEGGSDEDEVCSEAGFSVAVAEQNADGVIDGLDAVGDPAGGTPTAAALRLAKSKLDQLPAAGGKRAVVVATDGAPNCNLSLDVNNCVCTNPNGCDNVRNCLDDDGTIQAAADLNAAGYPVFVVGIPGVESFEHVLNGAAQSGGTAVAGSRQYYDATSATALSEALADVAERVGSCRFDLAAPPASASDVSVASGGSGIPRDPTRALGWDLVDADTIELFGAPCTAVVQSQADVVVSYCHAP